MLRLILGVVLGIVVGAIVTGVVEGMGHTIFPPPPGVNLTDPAQLQTVMSHVPMEAKLKCGPPSDAAHGCGCGFLGGAGGDADSTSGAVVVVCHRVERLRGHFP